MHYISASHLTVLVFQNISGGTKKADAMEGLFDKPFGVCVNSKSQILVSDMGNHRQDFCNFICSVSYDVRYSICGLRLVLIYIYICSQYCVYRYIIMSLL